MRGKTKIRPPQAVKQPKSVSDVWTKTLEPAILQIYKRGTERISFTEVYDQCYHLTNHEHGKALYRRFCDTTRQFLKSDIHPESLYDLARVWQDFQLSLRAVADVLMHVNRAYCKPAGIPSIEQQGELLFKEELLSANMQATLFEGIESALNAERQGRFVDTKPLKTIVRMLELLPNGLPGQSDSVYTAELEPRLVNATNEWYHKQLVELRDRPHTSREALDTLQDWLRIEPTRGNAYLPRETTDILLDTLQSNILREALPMFFAESTGVTRWLTLMDVESLNLAASLEQRAPINALVPSIAEGFSLRQRALNERINTESASKGSRNLVGNAIDWIEGSLELKRQAEQVGEAVNHSPLLLSAVATAQNHMQRFAEFLSLYVDDRLRKHRGDTGLEDSLRQAVELFDILIEKDRFETHYNLHLARRLLQSKIQLDLEELFLSLLQSVAGHTSTWKFSKMLNEVQLSREMCAAAGMSLPSNVNYVARNIWPKFVTQERPLVLPPVVDQSRQQFADFHASKFPSRILRWNFGMGSADMRVRVGDRQYMVTLPLPSLSVLMLFDNSQQYTSEEISAKTQIPLTELRRYLLPLASQKTPLLCETETGAYFFNSEFTYPAAKLRILPLAASKQEKSQQDEDSLRQLEASRLEKAKAAIVRIMKARKELTHVRLVQEAANLLSTQFPANPSLLKRALSVLLECEYIKRSDGDQNVYIYIA